MALFQKTKLKRLIEWIHSAKKLWFSAAVIADAMFVFLLAIFWRNLIQHFGFSRFSRALEWAWTSIKLQCCFHCMRSRTQRARQANLMFGKWFNYANYETLTIINVAIPNSRVSVASLEIKPRCRLFSMMILVDLLVKSPMQSFALVAWD